MEKYYIKIEGYCTTTMAVYEVESTSLEEAKEKAKEMYLDKLDVVSISKEEAVEIGGLTTRKRLTDKEWNLVSKLTHKLKIDDEFDIEYVNDDEDDYFIGREENERIPLEEGFKELCDCLSYPLRHYFYDKKDCKILYNLFKEFAEKEVVVDEEYAVMDEFGNNVDCFQEKDEALKFAEENNYPSVKLIEYDADENEIGLCEVYAY